MIPLRMRTDVRNHSPTGFNAGYEGSGPAQLALAMVIDHLQREPLRAQASAITLPLEDLPYDLTSVADLAERVAVVVYQDFKREVVARLPQGSNWEIAGADVGTVIDRIVAKKRRKESLS